MACSAVLLDAEGYYRSGSMRRGLNRPWSRTVKGIDLARHLSCSDILCHLHICFNLSSCSSLSPPLLLPSLLSSGPPLARLTPCVSTTCKHRRLSRTSPSWLTVSYRCGDNTVRRGIYTRTSTILTPQTRSPFSKPGTGPSSPTAPTTSPTVRSSVQLCTYPPPQIHPITQPSVTCDLYRYLQDGTVTSTPIAKGVILVV